MQEMRVGKFLTVDPTLERFMVHCMDFSQGLRGISVRNNEDTPYKSVIVIPTDLPGFLVRARNEAVHECVQFLIRAGMSGSNEDAAVIDRELSNWLGE
jgi:hypothetical protein